MIVKVAGSRFSVAREVTCTCPLPVVKPGAAAVMVVTPKPMPLTLNRVDPVPPSAMNMLEGVTAALEGSALVRVTNTPPGGAGEANVT